MGDLSHALDYQGLFRGTPTALLVLDRDLTIVDANDAYLAATMRSWDDLVGRPVFEAFPDNPDDPTASGATMLETSLRRVLREGVIDVMEIQKYDIPKPGGGFDVRYWAPVNAPVHGGDGRLRWIVHRVEDVTAYVDARDGAETARLAGELEAEIFARRRIQQRQEALQAVVDSLEVAVIGTDAAGRPVLHNDAGRRLIDGLAETTAEDWGPRLHLHHAHGDPIRADGPLLRALRGEQVQDAEIVRRLPGQPGRFFRVHSRPVTGQPGLAAVAAIHEITAERRAARFQECQLAIAKVIASPRSDILGDAVRLIGSLIGWDLVEFWNRDDGTHLLHCAGRWTDPAHPPPQGLPDVLPPDRGLPGRAWQEKHPIHLTDLSTIPGVDWGRLHTALAIPLPGGPEPLGVLICYSDTVEIPEDVRTEMVTGIAPPMGAFLARRRAEHLATELGHAHDQYVALAGHELRTPLTSIQSYTDLLLDEPGLTDDQRHMLTAIQRNAANLRAVVLKLLDVAALRAGRLDVQSERMDLAKVLREAAAAGLAADPTHPITVDAPETALIDGDPVRLRQVADELIANAQTWAAESTAVGIRLETDAHATVVSVINTGVPIRADEREYLFDPFYRGADARRLGVPGAGLGLSLARAIAHQHGGTITASEPGAPVTTFRVRIPTNRLD